MTRPLIHRLLDFRADLKAAHTSQPECTSTGRVASYWLWPQVSFRTCHEI